MLPVVISDSCDIHLSTEECFFVQVDFQTGLDLGLSYIIVPQALLHVAASVFCFRPDGSMTNTKLFCDDLPVLRAVVHNDFFPRTDMAGRGDGEGDEQV